MNKQYEFCIRCSRRYSVSRFRDKSKAFVCQDCERSSMRFTKGVVLAPIYGRSGFARVIGGER